MNINKIAGQKIFQDIQRKIAWENRITKTVAYCDIYYDTDNYCTDHHDTDRSFEEDE